MSEVLFKGEPVQLQGNFPSTGQAAPAFQLIRSDLSTLNLSDLAGHQVVLNIFPSVDTAVCALQLKTFSQRLSKRDDLKLVFASMDLPFALNRFCAAEGIENAITTSDFRHHSLAENYGVKMLGGPLAGLYARATLVLDADHNITYAELVDDITNEPDYDAAIEAIGAA